MPDTRVRPRRWVPALAATLIAGAAGVACGGTQDVPFVQPDASMERTIGEGTVVEARPAGAYRGRPGDVVVFRGGGIWGMTPDAVTIGRVIAVGGQAVACCDGDGRVLVDDRPLREGYLYFAPGRGSRQVTFARSAVPAGSLWIMGDNRNSALDSRDPARGPVPESAVIAVVTGEPTQCPPGAVSCPSSVLVGPDTVHH